MVVVEALATDGWSFEHAVEHSDLSAHGRYFFETMSSRSAYHVYQHFIDNMINRLTDCNPHTWDFNTPIFLTFENLYDFSVDVWWFNDDGDTLLMGTIPAGQMDVYNTWAGAPWKVTNTETRETIYVDATSEYFSYYEDAIVPIGTISVA